MAQQTKLLAVDGGGTKTEALLADAKGHILGYGAAGGANALSVGREKAILAVNAAIQSAVGSMDAGQISAAKLFIPGFGQCLPLQFPFDTPVYGDDVNAYYGAMGAPGGIVVLCGTGSFATSFDEHGAQVSVGGWGPMLGDEGSGYDIGKRAVQQTLRRYDAGVPMTALNRRVLEHYGALGAHELVHIIYHAGCDRAKMAQLCPVVGALARAGERDALNILSEAACAITALAKRLKERLKMEKAPLALTGGVAKLMDVMEAELKAQLLGTGLSLVEPMYSPAVGGVIYTYFCLFGALPGEDVMKRWQTEYLKHKGDKATC